MPKIIVDVPDATLEDAASEQIKKLEKEIDKLRKKNIKLESQLQDQTYEIDRAIRVRDSILLLVDSEFSSEMWRNYGDGY